MLDHIDIAIIVAFIAAYSVIVFYAAWAIYIDIKQSKQARNMATSEKVVSRRLTFDGSKKDKPHS